MNKVFVAQSPSFFGSIINISSVASNSAPPTVSAYSATKAAVDAVTKSPIRYCRTAPIADPIKSIPVLDVRSGRAKFVGAPLRYQMPIRVLAATLEDRRGLNASLILR